MGGGERRRVVEAVADHQHAGAASLQRLAAARSCRPASAPPENARRRVPARHRRPPRSRSPERISTREPRAELARRPPRVRAAAPAAPRTRPRARGSGKRDQRRVGPARRDRVGLRLGPQICDRAEPRRDAVDERARRPRREIPAARERRLCARAASAIALASGCWLDSASAPASAQIGGRDVRGVGEGRDRGSVSVPVLSKTTVSISASRSSASPELSIRRGGTARPPRPPAPPARRGRARRGR